MDSGLASFQRRMRAVPLAARRAVQPTLVREADKIADLMRALAPDDPSTAAPDLGSSIAVTGPGNATPPYSQPGGRLVVPELTAAITAGNADVRYPHLVEFGTRARMTSSKEQSGFHPGTAPQPFFWPALRARRVKAMQAIKRSIGKAIKEAR